jgi:hypothetical protein
MMEELVEELEGGVRGGISGGISGGFSKGARGTWRRIRMRIWKRNLRRLNDSNATDSKF